MKRLLVIAALTLASCGGAATSGASSPSSLTPTSASIGQGASTSTASATTSVSKPLPRPTTARPASFACFDLSAVKFAGRLVIGSPGFTREAFSQFHEAVADIRGVADDHLGCFGSLSYEQARREDGDVLPGGIEVLPGEWFAVIVPSTASDPQASGALLAVAAAVSGDASNAVELAAAMHDAWRQHEKAAVCMGGVSFTSVPAGEMITNFRVAAC